jgi:hypothetical protein
MTIGTVTAIYFFSFITGVHFRSFATIMSLALEIIYLGVGASILVYQNISRRHYMSA